MVKVQFQNLIASAKGAKSNAKSWKGDPSKNGLITAITSLSCTPDFDSGSVVTGKSGLQYPKLWRVNMSMQVLHNHLPGANKLRNLGFPYAGAVQSAINPQGNAADEKAVASQGQQGEQPMVGGEAIKDSDADQAVGAKVTKQGGSDASKTASQNPSGPGANAPANTDTNNNTTVESSTSKQEFESSGQLNSYDPGDSGMGVNEAKQMIKEATGN